MRQSVRQHPLSNSHIFISVMVQKRDPVFWFLSVALHLNGFHINFMLNINFFPPEFPFVSISFSLHLFTQHPVFISAGWTGEKVCLAGDSAGGNLCLTMSMRAAAFGVRMPDGIVAAYPATLLTAYASPSRLLSLMDPLLPLSVLSRCLSAYAGRILCVFVCLINQARFLFYLMKLRIQF